MIGTFLIGFIFGSVLGLVVSAEDSKEEEEKYGFKNDNLEKELRKIFKEDKDLWKR